MADGGVPPVSGGGGVAGIITAVGGLVTAVGVAVAAILERRARVKATPPAPTPEQIAAIARAVVLAEREADEAERPRAAKKRPAKPAKPRQTKGRHP